MYEGVVVTPLRWSTTTYLESATAGRTPWAWAGSTSALLDVTEEDWLESLRSHHVALTGEPPSESQVAAWRSERGVLASSFQALGDDAVAWNLVAEYELPFEGGRRPDVVVLAGETVLVLEFKTTPLIRAALVDQVAAYARDVAEYHEASHWRTVEPILVSTSLTGPSQIAGGVTVTGPGDLAAVLGQLAAAGTIDFGEWLASPYAPLPTLVEAARRIFREERLPHVWRAHSARIPETLELAHSLVGEAETASRRRLILITGVPGAGKTLVGLRLVYERTGMKATSTFLSGNGPLVKVLQDALKSSVFVRDLHKFITSYGTSARVPEQHILVFDEAQRAWDSGYMFQKKGVVQSEPELLVGIADRLEGWAALVGLVGTGQAIYSGEEGGMPLWRVAIESSSQEWEIFCPPDLADTLSGSVTTFDDLDLGLSLRSRQAANLHDWVAALLGSELREAEGIAAGRWRETFPMYLTRDLGEAREYARERYSNDPDARYGLLASSHASNLERFGVNNSWFATSRVREARWYNAPPGDPGSCCSLTQPVTEFACQGLELDLPIVCWGADARWEGESWAYRPKGRRYPIDDPIALLKNTYRVLLTRGRDGLLIWVPPERNMDETAQALELAGVDGNWQRPFG
jgi:DUF2075 family protein